MKKKLLQLTALPILIGMLIVNSLLPAVSFAQITKIVDYTLTNGSYPLGSLISDGTFLYGTTSQGGSGSCGDGFGNIFGCGTIFKVKPDGTGYVTLLDFNDTNGNAPNGSLVSDGTFLYGMTSGGGAYGYGIIFKIKPDGTGFVNMYDFGAISTSGKVPYGSLLYDGTFLYGMTRQGGTAGEGIIFKIMPDGTGFFKLLNFSGTNGSDPLGSLITDGTFLYGATSAGGGSSGGRIFKIKPDGTGLAGIITFNNGNGSSPLGDLLYDGTFLYGTTANINNNNGYIFKVKPDGTGYVGFSTPDGANPRGSLISDGTFLYGMTAFGGANNDGVIFKIMPDGTGFSKLYDFDSINGKEPHGSLLLVGTNLYGTTNVGGTNNKGTVFGFCISSCVAAPTVSVSGNTMTSSSASGNQWYLNGGIITGATSQSYTATQNGSYTVMVNGSSSAPTIISSVGIDENSFSNSINIYPNPNNGLFNLQMSQLGAAQIKIYNVLGECVYQNMSTASTIQIDLSAQSDGVYMVQIITEEGTVNKKLNVQR